MWTANNEFTSKIRNPYINGNMLLMSDFATIQLTDNNDDKSYRATDTINKESRRIAIMNKINQWMKILGNVSKFTNQTTYESKIELSKYS